MGTKEELQDVEKWVFNVQEVTRILGLSRNSIYQGIAVGEIPHIKIGKRILIPRASLEAIMEKTRRA